MNKSHHCVLSTTAFIDLNITFQVLIAVSRERIPLGIHRARLIMMRKLVPEIDVISFNRTNTRSDIRVVAVGVPTVTNYDVRLVFGALVLSPLSFPLVPATSVETREEAEKKERAFSSHVLG